jgi:FlaA1/EpsC-like NDP-sugar epimerase
LGKHRLRLEDGDMTLEKTIYDTGREHAAIRLLLAWFARRGRALQVPLDLTAWAAAFCLVQFVGTDFVLIRTLTSKLMLLVVGACSAQFVLGKAFYLYRGRYRYGSFEEVRGLVWTAVGTAVTLSLLNSVLLTTRWFAHGLLPLSAVLSGSLVALTLMAGTRYVWRLALQTLNRPVHAEAQRILVLGAGEGGVRIITAMLRDPHSPYLPVGLLDDDPDKRHLRVLGVAVMGTSQDMAMAAKMLRADALLVAIPSADTSLLVELHELAEAAGLPMKVLPSVSTLLNGPLSTGDIRDLDLFELVGRRPLQTDVDSVASYLTGKRVLVTGAGGSIGAELCRQVHRYVPAELIMLDRDESALHAVELSLRGTALLTDRNIVLADLRDSARMKSVFEDLQPQVVFHAAALKHLPLLQRYPCEALKTNVWGTLAVLDAVESVQVERFVNISTDKAADPISVLGYSKRIAERLTAGMARSVSGTYLSVRFGNVMGSRGSVLPLFEAQAAAGGPITVTHPEATRYFMTIEEAVQLVIQAGAIGRPGEVLVLDMGAPARIGDIAKRVAASAGRPVPIVHTGLRAGEKLHEELFGMTELKNQHTAHPLISHVPVPPLDASVVRALDMPAEPKHLIEMLRGLCLRDIVADPVVEPDSPETRYSVQGAL